MAKFSPHVVDVADALHSTAIHLLRQLRTEDRTAGIGPAQLSALSVLVFGADMSLKRLAQVEQVKPPTMVRIVQGLVEQKLAVSRPDAADARKIKITATPKGRALMQRARRRRVEALAEMLAGKSKTELKELQRAVSLLQELLAAHSTARQHPA